MALVVRDLGPLELEWEGTPVRPRPHLQTTLLSALVVDHHAVVPADRLVDALWPGGGIPHERLWFHVSRLRHLLPGGPALVERLAHGYRFAPVDAEVDSARFERLVVEATRREVSDPSTALDLLHDALGLWRGEFHEGVDLERTAPGVRHFWDEQRQAVEEQRLRLSLRIRPPATVIPELERLALARPEREVVVELLARALYAEGRQVDALDAIASRRRGWATVTGCIRRRRCGRSKRRSSRRHPISTRALRRRTPAHRHEARCRRGGRRSWGATTTCGRPSSCSAPTGWSHSSALPAWARRDWRARQQRGSRLRTPRRSTCSSICP